MKNLCPFITLSLTLILILVMPTACIKRDKPNYSIDTYSQWNLRSTNHIIKYDYQNRIHQTKWWEGFDDQILNNLIVIAIQNNIDFKIAQLRIIEARAKARKANSSLAPEIDITTNASLAKGNFSTSSSTFSSKKAVSLSTTSLDARWELDLFGVNSNLSESARHKLLATIAKKNHFLVTLIADVTTNYIDYRKYQQLLDINEKNASLTLSNLNMIKSKNKSGVSTDLDVNEANSLYIMTKTASHEFNHQRLKAQYRIETLCGASVGEFSSLLKKKQKIPLMNSQIIVNSPIYILRNRPDVIQAEEDFIAAVSVTKAAISSQYPQITLGGSLGYQQSNLLPDQLIWSIGSMSLTPFINFNRIKHEIDIKTSREEQAFLNYKQSVKSALEDIEESFIKYISLHNKYIEMKSLVLNNIKSLALATDLYNSATEPYTTVINSEKNLYRSKQNALEALAEYSKSAISVYKNLGYCL